MAVPDDLRLDALRTEAVSDAWKQLRVLSPVRSTLLASLFQAEVWCFGGVRLSFRVVRLGGPKMRKTRNNVALLLMVDMCSCIETYPLHSS